MRPSTNYPAKTIAAGFIVMVLFSLSLFWVRFFCRMDLIDMMPNYCRSVAVTPSGLLPGAIENDPNVAIHSQVTAKLNTADPWFLGIINYFLTSYSNSNILISNRSEGNSIYFNKETGLIVCHYNFYERRPDNSKFKKMVHFFAGPDGISETSKQNLGRFEDITAELIAFNFKENQPPEMTLFDKKIRRFFKIDVENKIITKGPELEQDDSQNPAQMGSINKNRFYITDFRFEPPQVDISERTHDNIRGPYFRDNVSYRYLSPLIPQKAFSEKGPYMLVLDETGRIDLLDRESLEFVETAGELPSPRTYFSGWRPPKVNPKDLLSYDIRPLFYKNQEDANSSDSTPEFLGVYAASVSRNGTALALQVFNKEGKTIAVKGTEVTEAQRRGRYVRNIPSSKAVYFEAPWSSTLTTILFITENLHPPILSIASLFTASSFEAEAGHRSLFLLPNSFFAMTFRDMEGNIIERFSATLSLMIPAILLSIILARQISRDCFVVGLTKKERTIWIILTLAFGVVAYFTYKLTKPKIALVTCQNCGKPRRPDMEKCHRCKNGWHVPELTPPRWRVLGEDN